MQLDMFTQIDDYVLTHIFSYVSDFISKVRMSNTCKRFGILKKQINAIRDTDKIKNHELVSHYNITTIYYNKLLINRRINESGCLIPGYFNIGIPVNLKNVDIVEYNDTTENKLVFDKLYFQKGYSENRDNCFYYYKDSFTITGTLEIFKK